MLYLLRDFSAIAILWYRVSSHEWCSLNLPGKTQVIKAPFTRDRINLGPIPDWVQIGLAFTQDLLEPVRCGPLPGTMWVHLRKGPSTDLDGSRSRVNGQDRSHFGSVSLSTLSNRSVHAVAGSYSSLISA